MQLSSQKSSFPIALGVSITGVDDATFSQTGNSYSHITLPHADTHVARVLQEDDTGLGAAVLNPYYPLTLQLTDRHLCRAQLTSL